MLPYKGPLSLLSSAHAHSTTPEARNGEVSEPIAKPTCTFSGGMSHETMPNVFLPMKQEEHLQLSQDFPSLTMDELAEELHLSYPVLSESSSPFTEQVLHTEPEEMSVETEGGNRLGQNRACSEREYEQAKKKTRFS